MFRVCVCLVSKMKIYNGASLTPQLVSLALLKLFIGCAYMSQSFYGISTGDNDNNGANNIYYRSLTERCEGDNCNSGGSGYYYGGDSYGSAGYSYSYGHDGNNNNGGGNQGTDVQLFCLWAGERFQLPIDLAWASLTIPRRYQVSSYSEVFP
jgi:hypothetical protein